MDQISQDHPPSPYPFREHAFRVQAQGSQFLSRQPFTEIWVPVTSGSRVIPPIGQGPIADVFCTNFVIPLFQVTATFGERVADLQHRLTALPLGLVLDKACASPMLGPL